MPANPKFSIVTVCRNEVEKIRSTCESICAQTFTDFEWIIIDGASTDGTLDVLEEYRMRTTVLVSEPDNGIYHAMNKGISHAKGEYIIFMNGGDYFAETLALEKVTQAPQSSIIYGDLLFDGKETTVKKYPDVIPPRFLLKNMLPHQASFIRRTLFERFGGHDESFRIAGDYELFVRLLEVHKVSTHHVAKVLAVFSDDGISKDPKYRLIRKLENHRVRKKYFPYYRFSLKGIKEEIRSRRTTL